jgi:hypothetical protein
MPKLDLVPSGHFRRHPGANCPRHPGQHLHRPARPGKASHSARSGHSRGPSVQAERSVRRTCLPSVRMSRPRQQRPAVLSGYCHPVTGQGRSAGVRRPRLSGQRSLATLAATLAADPASPLDRAAEVPARPTAGPGVQPVWQSCATTWPPTSARTTTRSSSPARPVSRCSTATSTTASGSRP